MKFKNQVQILTIPDFYLNPLGKYENETKTSVV